MHRIILTGKNKDFPKTISLPFGVGVDDSIVMWPVRVAANQRKCAACNGWGTIDTWDGNPSHRKVAERCTVCDGEGIETLEDA